MFEVWFWQDGQKSCVINPVTGMPLAFADSVEAWAFIEEVMSNDGHPQLMWLRASKTAE